MNRILSRNPFNPLVESELSKNPAGLLRADVLLHPPRKHSCKIHVFSSNILMKIQSFGFLFFGFILSTYMSFYFKWLKRKSTSEIKKNGIFAEKNLLFICDVPNYFWQKIIFPEKAKRCLHGLNDLQQPIYLGLS